MNTATLRSARSCLLSLVFLVGLSGASRAVVAKSDDPLAAAKTSPHRIEAAGGGHRADNPRNKLRFRFANEGVTVAPSTPGQDWRLALKLTGYGTPDRVDPVMAATLAMNGANRLEYRRGALTEWYENRPEGLEQGFTLAAPPRPGATAVVLDLAVSGGLQPRPAPDGQSVALLKTEGRSALTYGALKAIDARGVELQARLALADGKLRIAVRTQDAQWPIIVDPLVKSAVSFGGDAAGADRFGYAVAASGTTAAIGAPRDNQSGTNSGAAFIYVRNDGTWASQQADLAPADGVSGKRFGYAVAIHGDTAVMGAPFFNPGGSANRGKVYVFTRSGAAWTEQAGLEASDGASNDFFGTAVAVYGDTLIVGAPGWESTGTNRGAVYVFTRSGGAWTQRTIIQEPSPGNNHYFGSALALSGGRFVAGAPGATRPDESGSAAASFSGTAAVFSGSGASWTSEGALPASGLANGDRFGWSVALYALNDDPATAIVGAPFHDYVGTLNTGAAYVFSRTSGTWSQQAILEDNAHTANDQFGYSVALAEGAAVIGANLADQGATNAGAAYIFMQGTGTTWTQAERLLISDGGGGHTPSNGDNFGWAVAIAGNAPLVGAPNENLPVANHGAAVFYTFPCAFGRGYTAGQWMMFGIPCTPANDTDALGEIFGATNEAAKYGHFRDEDFYPTAAWTGAQWTVLKRDPGQQSNTNIRLTNLSTDTLGPGTGYWLYSGTAPTGTTGQANGAIGAIPLIGTASTASPLVAAGSERCPANSNGCYAIPLVVGSNRYNMVGNGLPFDVDWADVIVDDGTSAYTPSGAETAGLMSKNFWVYNGSGYSTFDDGATPGTIRVMRSFFVKTLTATGTLRLLIPAKPTLKTSAARPLPWYPGWLDRVIPTAAADTSGAGGEPVVGLEERDRHVRELEQAITAKRAWKVQLSVEIDAKSLRDTGNWLGQIPGAEIGFDPADLPELPPLTPYLTLVFPHPEWAEQAGDYTTDYHPAPYGDVAARTWTFEIRTDQVGQEVFLGWQGDPALLRRCTVTDVASGQVFELKSPRYRFGMPVFMDSKVKQLIWRYDVTTQ